MGFFLKTGRRKPGEENQYGAGSAALNLRPLSKGGLRPPKPTQAKIL